VIDPLFWLGLSILLVAVSLTAVLVAALPAFRELARAARSAEKLFDTLSRDLPPTLEAIRLTGMEISDLTDDVSEGVQSAGRVVKQFDDSLQGVKRQARKAQLTTRSLMVGVKAAWKSFRRHSTRQSLERLPAHDQAGFELNKSKIHSSQSPSLKVFPDAYLSHSSHSSEHLSDHQLDSKPVGSGWQIDAEAYEEYEEYSESWETNALPLSTGDRE
jgi:uncharacterized protein YoxC